MLNKLRHKIMDKVIEDNLDYLVRFAFFRLDDRAEAEDIVHDAILRFLELDSKEIRPAGLRLYLFRIVYNLCQDALRCRSKKSVPLENMELTDPTEEETLDSEEAERLNHILSKIPDKEAEIVRMNIIDGLSFVEISHILSIPASTAKSRFKSGIEKIRKQYFSKSNSHGRL